MRNETLKCSIDEKALQTLLTEVAADKLEAKAQDKRKEAEARLKLMVEDTLKKKIDSQGSGLLKDLFHR